MGAAEHPPLSFCHVGVAAYDAGFMAQLHPRPCACEVAPVTSTQSESQVWRITWTVKFVPPKHTAELENGRKVPGPAFIESEPRWERVAP